MRFVPSWGSSGASPLKSLQLEPCNGDFTSSSTGSKQAHSSSFLENPPEQAFRAWGSSSKPGRTKWGMDAVDKLALLLASTLKPAGEYPVVDGCALERGAVSAPSTANFASRRRRLVGWQRASRALTHTAVDAFGERR
jgi:hypothetical protein